MKIDRLYTLSQFVDHVEEDKNGVDLNSTECYSIICKYNDFLKQPIKKEMFVCEVAKPSYPENALSDGQKMTEYEQAQNKVIFDGVDSGYDGVNIKSFILPKGEWVDFFPPDLFEYENEPLYSLNDLAEATKGQLKTKNIVL